MNKKFLRKWEKWYILAAFAVLGISQCLTWMSYGTIPESTYGYYNIGTSELDLLLNWGPIIYVFAAIPVMALISSPRGLRNSMRIGVILVLLANISRCIPTFFIKVGKSHDDNSDSDSIIYSDSEGYEGNMNNKSLHAFAMFFVHLGQILNAIAGPITMSPAALLSHIWFEEDLRATATTGAWIATCLGIAVTYFMGPALAPTPSKVPIFLWFSTGLAVLGFIMVFLHFPQKPSYKKRRLTTEYNDDDDDDDEGESGLNKPLINPSDEESSPTPSNEASINNNDNDEAEFNKTPKQILIDCLKDVKYTLTLRDGLVTFLIGGFQMGMVSGWNSVLPQVISGLGNSQQTAGLVSFICSCLGMVGCFATGKVTDLKQMRKRHKQITIVALIVSISFICLSLLFVPMPGKSEPLIVAPVYAVGVFLSGFALFLGGMTPLFYEMQAEITFPVNEGVSSGLIALLGNLITVFFLFVAPLMNSTIFIMVLAASHVIVVVAVAFIRVTYKRQQNDAEHDMNAN